MTITNTWSPILLTSTLLLWHLSQPILVLAHTGSSSSDKDRGTGEAQPASIESHGDFKFQQLVAQYRSTLSSLEHTTNRVFGAVWYANALYLFLNTFNVTVQENLMDEFKSKLDALREQKNKIARTTEHGRESGLLLDAQKALKDFEQPSGPDSQKSTKAALKASIAALKSSLEPLASIAIGYRLKDDQTHDDFIVFIEKWESYQRNYLKRQGTPVVYEEAHLTVAQTMVETWLKVLNCEPDAEQAVERAGKVVYDSIHDANGRLSYYPGGFKLKRKSSWKPLIIPGIVASAITFGFLYFLGSTLMNHEDGSELTTGSGNENDDSGLVSSMVPSFTTGGYGYHNDTDDNNLLFMIALVLGVALVLLIAVGLAFWYYFSRKRITRTNDV